MECGSASLEVPFQTISTCVKMKTAVSIVAAQTTRTVADRSVFQLPRCEKRMQESCIDRFDAIDCRAAVNFCDSTMSSAFEASGKFAQCDFEIKTSKSDTLGIIRRTQLLRHLQGMSTNTHPVNHS